jgi:integrase/recombinase XerD
VTARRSAALARTPQAPRNIVGARTDDQMIAVWLHGRRPHTIRAYSHAWRWWAARLRVSLRRLTLRDVQAADDATAPPSTRAWRMASLRSLLRAAHRAGYVSRDLGPFLRVPRVDWSASGRILEPGQVAALLAAAARPTPRGTPARNHALVRLLYHGLRRAEVVALDVDHVHPRDTGDGSIHVTGKGGRVREVWISPATVAELADLARGRAGPLFLSRTGRRLTGAAVSEVVQAAARAAGLKVNPTAHWLRHSCATHAAQRGAPLHEIAAELGHASVATTTHYLHARPLSGIARYLGL